MPFATAQSKRHFSAKVFVQIYTVRRIQYFFLTPNFVNQYIHIYKGFFGKILSIYIYIYISAI